MDKISLIMVLHGHQPVGNFDKVFALATKVCYRPVVETFAKYPEFKLGLHFSGPLLSWLEKGDPKLLDTVAAMVKRGQVEMLTGGFYEPLLASIPARDALGQLGMMTRYIFKRFGQEPKGLWLSERVWEPGLPAKIGPAKLGYTLVDDTHLTYAGLPAGGMFGHYITEREGHTLAILPTHIKLRYTIPFQEPQATLDFLKMALDKNGPTCATYGDDTEKFGLWPDTYEWVFGKKWLVRFIEAVLKNDDWLRTDHAGRWVAQEKARGRVYLPTASYEEMGQWALPSEAAEDLIRAEEQLKAEKRWDQFKRWFRGGIWDNFLVKYRESNIMHKRMLAISNKVEACGDALARDHMYQAQCNCAYWHGLFGGLYLGHLRQAIHEHLIIADSLCDEISHGTGPWAEAARSDVDMDGNEEIALASAELDLLVHPSYGGSVSVLNLREKAVNIADVLTRRREAYHRHLDEYETELDESTGEVKSIHDIVRFKDEGLQDMLVIDWYDRACFQDHLLAPEATAEKFQRPDYGEWGDLVTGAYEVRAVVSQTGGAGCDLRRESFVYAPGGPYPLSVDKSFRLEPGGRLSCAYKLTTGEDSPAMRLGVELNLTLLSEVDPLRHMELSSRAKWGFDELAEAEDVEWLRLINRDQGYIVRLTPGRPAGLWHFPVETVSQSEDGLEKTYQGSSLMFVWDVPAGAGEHKFELLLELE